MGKKKDGVCRLSVRNIVYLNSGKIVKQSPGCLWVEEERKQIKTRSSLMAESVVHQLMKKRRLRKLVVFFF